MPPRSSANERDCKWAFCLQNGRRVISTTLLVAGVAGVISWRIAKVVRVRRLAYYLAERCLIPRALTYL